MVAHIAIAQEIGIDILPHRKSNVDVPFDYIGDHIIVNVRLGYDFYVRLIVDTGAENIIFFDDELAHILGLEFDKEIQLRGADLEEEITAHISRQVPFQLENCQQVNRDIVFLEDNNIQFENSVGTPVHGIIGSRFFTGLIMDFNYARKKLSLSLTSEFTPPDNYIKLPIEIINRKPYINCTTQTNPKNEISTKFLIDTGSALSLIMYGKRDSSGILPDKKLSADLGTALGGTIKGHIAKVKSLEITPELTFENITTRFQVFQSDTILHITEERSGIIGNPILSKFRMIIDFLHKTIYLKPNKKFKKELKNDLTGLVLYHTGKNLNKVFAHSVIEQSPAVLADIRKGDYIDKIGVWPVKWLSIDQVNRKMSHEGKTLRLVVIREGKKLKKKLVLRDYVP